MLAEGVHEEATVPSKNATSTFKSKDESKATAKKEVAERQRPSPHNKSEGGDGSFTPELAVNVQIHISADATGEQIDAIFASMKKYFGK